MKTILFLFFFHWVKIPDRITLEEGRFISSVQWGTGHGGWGSFCGGPNLCCSLFCFVLLYFSPYTRKQRDKIRKVKEAITLNAHCSNTLPPARLQLLKVPQPLRTVPPSGDQVNTHMSLGGTFYVQTITKGSRCLSSLPFPDLHREVLTALGLHSIQVRTAWICVLLQHQHERQLE